MTALDLRSHTFSALIFDCDGTLAETAPFHQKSMAHAVAAQGFEMAPEWYFERVGLSRVDLFREFELVHEVSLDQAAAIRDSMAFFRTVVHRVQPIKAIVATARHYHGRFPMAVASGAESSLVRASLTAIGALDMFEHIVTVTEVPVGKPAPDLFLEAARRVQVNARDCLVFEDSPEGLEAARRAQMNAIDVRPHVAVA